MEQTTVRATGWETEEQTSGDPMCGFFFVCVCVCVCVCVFLSKSSEGGGGSLSSRLVKESKSPALFSGTKMRLIFKRV